jgi:hypothetical protein
MAGRIKLKVGNTTWFVPSAMLTHAAKLEAELLVTVASRVTLCGRLPGTLLGHSSPRRDLSSCFSWCAGRDETENRWLIAITLPGSSALNRNPYRPAR